MNENLNNIVLFTSGGSGSGKTTALRGLSILEKYSIIYDSRLCELEKSKEIINKAINNGYKVQIVYFYRTPEEAFSNGVIPKIKEDGIITTIEEHIDSHKKAFPVLLHLKQEYAEKIAIGFIDNSGNIPQAVSYNQIRSKIIIIKSSSDDCSQYSQKTIPLVEDTLEQLDVNVITMKLVDNLRNNLIKLGKIKEYPASM